MDSLFSFLFGIGKHLSLTSPLHPLLPSLNNQCCSYHCVIHIIQLCLLSSQGPPQPSDGNGITISGSFTFTFDVDTIFFSFLFFVTSFFPPFGSFFFLFHHILSFAFFSFLCVVSPLTHSPPRYRNTDISSSSSSLLLIIHSFLLGRFSSEFISPQH